MLLLTTLLACAHRGDAPVSPTPSSPTATEVLPRLLTLAGPAASPDWEFSGLAWCGGQLLLLPQYPEEVYVLTPAQLATEGPLTPTTLPFRGPGKAEIPGFEGYESITCAPDGTVWATIEARPAGMTSWLVSGRFDAAGGVTLDGPTMELPSPSGRDNSGDEALFLWSGDPTTLHEINTPPFVAAPTARRGGAHPAAIPMPALPFRITDAAPPDADGIVWVVNYLYEGDKDLYVGHDPVAKRWGVGPTHAAQAGRRVERLVALHLGETITLADRAPIQLVLGPKGRNWEGIAPVEGGFYLITDEYPETLLAFVPTPG